ncbi:PREDICTED: uncharacterized protein LOC105972513 [Erythranthe guttata]|uniref:uncharacterized protein LOC105972513 n=1 Tax=Erythranthe guttata TaxID=4155 RepID=UPI00064DEFD3|nr:PREDICTED: uncharacterized protein LOC105972513 [Erythranthe guttata]|eukprot:XP_012852928.1 PREDICTED: uncharacterized protein LOC105972513 [Erythranthe guttata]
MGDSTTTSATTPTSSENVSTTTPTILSTPESFNTIIIINTAIQIPLKLTSTNYTSWKFQFHPLLVGFDLLGFIDGTKPCPSPFLSTTEGEIHNPNYSFWIRQDNLILNAIVGSLSPTLIPFIASAKTSHEAWLILANTYARPSCGRISQLKEHLRILTKGTQSMTEYLQTVKSIADDLAMLNAPINNEDLILKILGGLDDEYKTLSDAIRVCETTTTFDELHEKLINHEAYLQLETAKNLKVSASANPTHKSLPRY